MKGSNRFLGSRRINNRNAVGRPPGQSSLELIVGSVLLVPIALFGINLSVMVLANSANDGLAKSAARAAANQGSRNEARLAAKSCVASFRKSPVIVDVRLADELSYDKDSQVVVKTIMTIKIPAPFAGFELLKFEAQAVEPVIAAPADV